MSVHTLAYEGSVAATSYTSLQGITDVYPLNGTDFMLKSDRKCIAAQAGGAIIAKARINQPSLNVMAYPSIEPLVVGAEPGSNPGVCTFGPVDLPIKGNENLKVEVANSSTVATNAWALLWVYDSLVPMPQGPVFKIRFSSSTTLAVNGWTQLSGTTFDSTLPQGNYAVVGITGISAGCIAVRLQILGQFDQPGFPGLTAEGQILPDFFREYGLGQLGTFPSYSLPNISFLSASADTSESGYLHVIKIG